MPVSAFELLALAPRDRIDYRVVGRDGETLTGDNAAPRPPGTGTPSFYSADFDGEPARYVAVTRRFAERGYSGPVQVIVGHTLQARRALAFDIAQTAVVGLGAAGVLIAVLRSCRRCGRSNLLIDLDTLLGKEAVPEGKSSSQLRAIELSPKLLVALDRHQRLTFKDLWRNAFYRN